MCKNGCIDRDAVLDAECGGSRELCIRRECTLAQSGPYDWIVHVRRRCGLMSNYFDHLFLSASSIRLSFTYVRCRNTLFQSQAQTEMPVWTSTVVLTGNTFEQFPQLMPDPLRSGWLWPANQSLAPEPTHWGQHSKSMTLTDPGFGEHPSKTYANLT